MAKAYKRLLSESVDGKPILITKTSTSGDLIHTAVAGTVDGTYDEIWLWAFGIGDASVVLTIEFGDTSGPPIIVVIPAQSGMVPVVPGNILQNAATVTAFASDADVVAIIGFVNAISD